MVVVLPCGYYGAGATGVRTETGRCSECGASGFYYDNGTQWSRDGVRGYRCVTCGAIKPEAPRPLPPYADAYSRFWTGYGKRRK